MAKWIKDVPQWICWKEQNGVKRPCDSWGQWCGSNSRECYMTFEDARMYAQLRGLEGAAWCFTPEDEYLGVDLDDCYNPETREFAEWSVPILERLHEIKTYYERSPSDTGIKAWISAKMPEGWATKKRIDGGGMIEIFGKSHQFFTFTGNKWPCQYEQVTDGQEFIEWLLERYGFHKIGQAPLMVPSSGFRGGESVLRNNLLERMLGYADSVDVPSTGGRNTALFKLAGHLNAFVDEYGIGPAPEPVLEVVRQFNARMAEPLSDEEVQRCVRSGIENGTPREKKEGRHVDFTDTAIDLATAHEIGAGTDEQAKDAKENAQERLYRRMYSFPELMTLDTTQEWLIDGVLVAREPCIIAGPSKCLKTSVTIDLAISLAMGGNFLQNPEWPIAEPRRVVLMSGESGIATLQETSRRIFQSAGGGEAYERVGRNLLVSPDIPKYGNVRDCKAIEALIEAHETDVLIVDPAYLAVPIGESASNMFAVGEIIAPMAQMCEYHGCMMILLHHARKNRTHEFKPMELSDISWSGFDAFARQWLLVSRQKRYDVGSGCHDLWLSWGGSAGHSGLRGLTINEGVDVHHRTWIVDVYTEDQATGKPEDIVDSAEQETAEMIQARKVAKYEEDRRSILKYLADADRRGKPWVTIRSIQRQSGARSRAVNDIIQEMLADGDIAVREAKIRGNETREFRIQRAQEDTENGGE